MLGVGVAILFAGLFVADAIMFVNGYRGYFHHAKTDQEKEVRAKWFEERGLEWDGKK